MTHEELFYKHEMSIVSWLKDLVQCERTARVLFHVMGEAHAAVVLERLCDVMWIRPTLTDVSPIEQRYDIGEDSTALAMYLSEYWAPCPFCGGHSAIFSHEHDGACLHCFECRFMAPIGQWQQGSRHSRRAEVVHVIRS